MRFTKRLAAIAAACSSLAVTSMVVAQVSDWKQIKKPPLSEFKIQEPKRIQLGNGMVIFLQEDHELPLISGTLFVRGGSREEPAEKTGLVSIFGQAWRTGGTKTRTGDHLDDFLEARAAKVETFADHDSSTIAFDSLKGDFDAVFEVVLDLLKQPEFREEKIVLAKNQLNTGIARRNDDPLQIANREAQKLGYGANSPYARSAEYYTVSAVTRHELLAWHGKYLHPNNMSLGVVGDFDGKKMEQTLRKAFESWPKGPAAPKVQIEIPEPKPGVYFIGKDDINQSSIRMVHLGTTRDNPDYHALEVMNEVFGGGFSARLFSNIRSKKGLAYNVGGGVGSDWDHPGLFRLVMGTKSETTAAAIDALNEELDNLQKTPATAEELQRAKESILNSFIFRFDTKDEILAERMLLEFYGYPSDFTQRYRAGIEKVTAEDVARVARKYVQKDKVALLVVGKASDFDRPLASYGTVQTIDITIPESKPGEKKSEAAPAGSNAAGKALLAKAAQAVGGAKALAVNSIRQKASILAKTPQGEMNLESEGTVVFPDRIHQKMTTPMGTMSMVVSPTAAFMENPMGTRDLPASQKDNMLKEAKRSPFYIIKHADDPGYTFVAGGNEKVGDTETTILDVRGEGMEFRWFIDPKSGRILRTSSKAMGPTGPAQQVSEYSDFRTVGGITVPYKMALFRDGEAAGSVVINEFEVNVAVDPKMFEKSAPQQ